MSATRIFCEQIDPIWEPRNLIRFEQTVDIWKIKLRDISSVSEDLISNDERLKASRFLHAKDRTSFICRRAALRILLSRYTDTQPSEIEFTIGENKKPEMRTESNKIHFNVSHSGELALIAISNSPIGVDIERIEPGFKYDDILKHSFSELEISGIEQAADSREVFFRLWTRKEALTKANSKGLDDDLRYIPCLDGWHYLNENLIGLNGIWLLKSFSINTEYVGSVACPADKKVNCFNFEF